MERTLTNVVVYVKWFTRTTITITTSIKSSKENIRATVTFFIPGFSVTLIGSLFQFYKLLDLSLLFMYFW